MGHLDAQPSVQGDGRIIHDNGEWEACETAKDCCPLVEVSEANPPGVEGLRVNPVSTHGADMY